MVLIKTARYIFDKWQIYNISKIKTKQHDETYDLTSFMANPAAQMLKNINKLVCVSLGYSPSILNSFFATLASKLSQNFVLFLFLR
jgi:hypothetical protein